MLGEVLRHGGSFALEAGVVELEFPVDGREGMGEGREREEGREKEGRRKGELDNRLSVSSLDVKTKRWV